MKYYNELLSLGCFSLDDIKSFIPNKETAKNMLKEYIKKGAIERIKRNYYVAMDIVDNAPIFNKYVIATRLDDSNYIAYHSALEYYGYHNQVMNEVIFCGTRRFNDFYYDGNNYHYVASKCDLQIEEKEDSSRVTSLERTIIDCIDNLELAGGLEELYRAFDYVSNLNEKKFLDVLESYDKKSLYQRTGFILSSFQEQLGLSDKFFKLILKKINNSVCYLDSKKGKTNFDSKWNVCYPSYLGQILNNGINIKNDIYNKDA